MQQICKANCVYQNIVTFNSGQSQNQRNMIDVKLYLSALSRNIIQNSLILYKCMTIDYLLLKSKLILTNLLSKLNLCPFKRILFPKLIIINLVNLFLF